MIDPSAARASRWCRMGAQYVDDGLHFGTRCGQRAAGRAQRGPLVMKKKEEEEMRRQAMIDP